MKTKKKYEIGIALGGGGQRGFAHFGILKALNEKGIYPDMISGVSAGAIAGAFIADGKEPEEAFNLLKKNKFADFTRIIFPIDGFFSLDKLNDNLKNLIEADDVKDLKLPFYAAATNLTDGTVEYFDEGPLHTIIQASSSIPVVFSPVEIDGKLYVDGGIFDNVPVTPLLGKCKKIIAVNVNPMKKAKSIKNFLQVADRVTHLVVNQTIKDIKDKCDIFIEPKRTIEYEILSSDHPDKLFEIGYEYCKSLDI